jgi:hypothetical protein
VYPFEVEEALLAHPDVDEAVSFPVPDAKFGASVAAAVVLRSGANVRTRDLKWFAFTHLASYKVPQRLIVMDAIPKVDREALAQILGLARGTPSATIIPIRTDGSGSPIFVVGEADGSRLRTHRSVYRIDLSQLAPPHTVEHAAAECVHAVRRVQPEGPYTLAAAEGARSVAIEMARQLEQAAEYVEFVALLKSGGRGPQRELRYDRRHSWPGRTIDAHLAGVE